LQGISNRDLLVFTLVVDGLWIGHDLDLDRKPPVRRTMPPSESVVASWYENASLLDSYSIALGAWERSSMRELATRKLVNPPAWQKALIALRDAMVTPFGIKTSDAACPMRPSRE
jgi:Protein of unknown function (DUF2867)